MHDGSEQFIQSLAGVRRGRLSGFDEDGAVLIETEGGQVLAAETLVAVGPAETGLAAAYTLVDDRPLILGLIQPPAMIAGTKGKKTVIESDCEVQLKCGKASITLYPDGRVAIRGTQILSRSDGANRVQGATVLLN